MIKHIQVRLSRKLELMRGLLAQLNGVKAGQRFGIGHRVSILHPDCLVVGKNVFISELGYLYCRSRQGVYIGDGTTIDRNVWIHCGGSSQSFECGYVKIGHRCYIGCNAVLGGGGGIQIGNYVLIGQSVNIHAENHIFNDPNQLIRQQGVTYQSVIIEDDVWIGSKATILAGVTIGRGAVVAAGSVVNKPVPSMAVVAGVPARVIRWRSEES